MVLQILNANDEPEPEEVMQKMHEAISGKIPDAKIDLRPKGPGHFEISVVSPVFEGQSRVQQHQLVYGAIWHLMSGTRPPVHAIDRLECQIPTPDGP